MECRRCPLGKINPRVMLVPFNRQGIDHEDDISEPDGRRPFVRL